MWPKACSCLPQLVCGSTRFHDHRRLAQLSEKDLQFTPREAAVELDPARLLGNRELEHSLCHIHRDDGMLFHGLLLFLAKGRLWHMMPIETQGESIRLLQQRRHG